MRRFANATAAIFSFRPARIGTVRPAGNATSVSRSFRKHTVNGGVIFLSNHTVGKRRRCMPCFSQPSNALFPIAVSLAPVKSVQSMRKFATAVIGQFFPRRSVRQSIGCQAFAASATSARQIFVKNPTINGADQNAGYASFLHRRKSSPVFYGVRRERRRCRRIREISRVKSNSKICFIRRSMQPTVSPFRAQ